MAQTSTAKLGLPQWGLGSDSPSRAAFNGAFLNIDNKSAVDLGEVGGSALPVSDVVAGRTAPVINGSYRQLFRRDTAGWKQVGGNMWPEAQYARGDASLAVTTLARQISHPNLTNPTVVENWDGSSVRGGRQAIGDVNAAQPGAVHVGDTASAVDLTTLGRVYARAAASGERGFVASAYGSGAGPLFTARTTGGDPWTVDSQGRMRAQAPSAFGAAALAANVPFVSQPSGTDLSGMDLYAASGKPALRIFRAAGDQIGQFLPDSISLGKAGWTGGALFLNAPSISLIGTLDVTGNTVLDGLTVGQGVTVQGASSLAGVSAGAITASSLNASGSVQGSSVTASGSVQGSSVTATGSISAEGGKVSSATSGSGAIVSARPPVQASGTALQSLRAPAVCYRSAAVNRDIPTVTAGEATQDISFVMPEDGYLMVEVEVLVNVDLGASGSLETNRSYFTFELRSTSASIAMGSDHVATTTTDDSARQIFGQDTSSWWDIYTTRLTAGNYVLRVHFSCDSILLAKWARYKAKFTPVMLHSVA